MHTLLRNSNVACLRGHCFVVAYPLFTMTSAPTEVRLLSTPNAYIISHKQFSVSKYDNDVHNKLILTDLSLVHNVSIDVIYIELGNLTSCKTGEDSEDVFRILKDNQTNETIFECADIKRRALPSVINIQKSVLHSLIFQFLTNGQQTYQGVLVLYKGEFQTCISY